ncbi:hypothetical protein ACN38_g3415 [Penicillium nordicum]|uniref:Uncharacterized protein n=1 Tax=Penicillium nordicum TaxID=229535 RepID=A0A0M8P8G2_9EURO|nr:hypothetical protein ACN38_g3415 [Penicillium nordicum]
MTDKLEASVKRERQHSHPEPHLETGWMHTLMRCSVIPRSSSCNLRMSVVELARCCAWIEVINMRPRVQGLASLQKQDVNPESFRSIWSLSITPAVDGH